MDRLASRYDGLTSDVNRNDPKTPIKSLPGNGVSDKLYRRSIDTQMSVLSDDVLMTSADRVTFNVGGVIFQTTRDTCRKRPCKRFKLCDRDFLADHYDQSRSEYFFDRDPEVFRAVLNFWRTGNLHLPLTVCGPYIKDELEFWGLRELDIEPCCWDSYNMGMKSVEALGKLERDRQPAYLNMEATIRKRNMPLTTWQRYSLAVWNFLTEPSYSTPAKIYAYISLLFVVFAIFSFCASTHKDFQLNNDDDNATNITSQANSSLIVLPANNGSNTTTTSTDNTAHHVSTKTSQRTHRPPRERGKDIIIDSNIHPALFYIDVVCLAFFTLEYLLRLLCAPGRLRFVISISSVVDLMAILPDYLEFLIYSVHADLESASFVVQFMPFLRLMRALRIFRLVRRVPGLWIMLYTLKASFKELSLMLVFLIVGTLFFSSVIFFVDDPSVFESIPHSFWWAIVTMTTVGYGDIAPVTAWGKLVGSVTAICGVLLVGFTIPALVNNFITYYQLVEFVYKKERLMTQLLDTTPCEWEETELDEDPESRGRLLSTEPMLPEN